MYIIRTKIALTTASVVKYSTAFPKIEVTSDACDWPTNKLAPTEGWCLYLVRPSVTNSPYKGSQGPLERLTCRHTLGYLITSNHQWTWTYQFSVAGIQQQRNQMEPTPNLLKKDLSYFFIDGDVDLEKYFWYRGFPFILLHGKKYWSCLHVRIIIISLFN